MLTLPKSLLPYYSQFTAFAVDDLNIINALFLLLEEKRSRWWRWFRLPDEGTVDLGTIVKPVLEQLGISAPEISLKWNKKQEDKVNSGLNLAQANREKQLKDALKLQEKLLKSGKYRHNIAHPQSKTEQKLLDSSLTRPGQALKKEQPQHGELVVIDATIEVLRQENKPPEFRLVDYPTPFKKESDEGINLKLSDSTKEKLNKYGKLAIGWHPSCRVLGRYITLEVEEPVLEALLISFRNIGPVDITIYDKLHQEFDHKIFLHQEFDEQILEGFWNSDSNVPNKSIEDLIFKYFSYCEITWKTELSSDVIYYQELTNQDIQTSIENNINDLRKKNGLSNSLEIIQEFEDDIFFGPMGFLIGLDYFLKTYRGQNTEQISKILKNSFTLPDIEDWNARLPYLNPFGVIRFKETQINDLLGDLATNLRREN